MKAFVKLTIWLTLDTWREIWTRIETWPQLIGNYREYGFPFGHTQMKSESIKVIQGRKVWTREIASFF